MSMLLETTITPLTQLGAAGIMGGLWVWERGLSSRRERELNEAHSKLMAQREALAEFMDIARQNARIIERFDQTQERLARAVDSLTERLGDRHDPALRRSG
ncbi:MAG: hypothetical protein RIG82_08205 [Phycisphaeraceae bacterium]